MLLHSPHTQDRINGGEIMANEMSREDFIRYLGDPKAAVDASPRTNWVGVLADLQARSEPFTVRQVFEELIDAGTVTKRNYVYSHLRDWAAERKILGPVAGPGGNYYLGKVDEED